MRCGRFSAVLSSLCFLLNLDVSNARACSTTCRLLGSAEMEGPTGSLGLDFGTIFTEGASYDLPNGTVAGGYECSCTSTHELIVARDAFRLNAQGTTPVAIDVEVQFTTIVEGPGSVKMTAGEEGSPLVVAQRSSSGTGSFVAHLTMIPNASEVVQFGVTALPTGSNQVRSHVVGRLTYRFLGIPANCSITSCNGFFQASAVPALTESWGSLKAAYR